MRREFIIPFVPFLNIALRKVFIINEHGLPVIFCFWIVHTYLVTEEKRYRILYSQKLCRI